MPFQTGLLGSTFLLFASQSGQELPALNSFYETAGVKASGTIRVHLLMATNMKMYDASVYKRAFLSFFNAPESHTV